MVPVILPRLAPRPVLVRVRALSAVGVFMTVGVFVLVRVAVLRAVRVRVLVRVLVPTFYPQGIWDYEVHPSEPLEFRRTVTLRFLALVDQVN